MSEDLHPILSVPANQDSSVVSSSSVDRFSAAAAFHLQLQRYWLAMRRRWWVVALCFVLIGGPSIAYAILAPRTFRSYAIMWLTSKLSLPGGPGFFSEEMSSYMSTQAELMKSPAIQQRAFDKVRAAFPEVALLFTNPQPEHLPFDLNITSSPKNSVLNLEARGKSPLATRAFLDAVMEEYLELKKGSHQQTSVGALTGITDQLRDVEKQIKSQQDELSSFGASNNISYLTEHGLSAGSHLAKLDEMLSDLLTEQRLLQSLTPEQASQLSVANPAQVSETPLPGEKAARATAAVVQPSENAYYQALQQLQLLKAKRDDFARVLRPTHSKMVKLNQEISGWEQLLQALKAEGGQRAMAQIENRKASLALQIESLETQRRAWETNAIKANSKLVERDRLNQQLQRSQAIYDRLLALLQTMDLNKSFDQEPLSPLAPASAARPMHTNLKVGCAGVAGSLLAGLVVLFLLEFLNDRFTSVTELSYHIPEEIIGQIPEARLGQPNGRIRLLTNPQEHHAFTESFRSLRSSLFFMFEDAAKPRVILITSSVPKEGKSTVAAHLAGSLAVSGARVLLVDADLRRSCLHQIFGVARQPGLREVLLKVLPVGEAIVPVRLPAAMAAEAGVVAAQLALLPGGEAGQGTGELLLRSEASQLLRELASRYEYVIIDSPPLLATDDATSLASKVDGVFMVVRASFTYSRMVREALERLHKCRGKILGLVYNRAATSTDYYYRYSQDYSSSRGGASVGGETKG